MMLSEKVLEKYSQSIKLSKDQEERAAMLHREAVVVDSCSLSYSLENEYLEQIRKGGVNVAIVSVNKGVAETSQKLVELKEQPELVTLVDKYGDLESTVESGRLAVFFGTQNCEVIEKNIDLLQVYYKLGYRSFGPTYSFGNLLGAGCIERYDYGLTYYGVDVIEEINSLGCLVDVSHCGDKVTDESISLAKYPVATHSNSRTLANSTRNKRDDQIKAIAEKDGIVGCVAAPNFVVKPDPSAAREKPPMIGDYVDHIEHITNIVGVDYVGMGLDFIAKRLGVGLQANIALNKKDKFGMYRQRTLPLPSKQFGSYEDAMTIPYAVPCVERLIDVTRGLVEREYTDEEIMKILGGNWLRVFNKILV
jgi:membrane dipeptidase